MVAPKSPFDVIQEAANHECEEVGRHLYERFQGSVPKDIVTQSVASAVALITMSLLGATYETLRKSKDEKTAREWIDAALADVGMVLGHSGLDFKFTLKPKEAS